MILHVFWCSQLFSGVFSWVGTLMIQRNSMIPSYLMSPAIRWSAAIWWAPAIPWSPALRWSIESMDFNNQKVYGDIFISDGLAHSGNWQWIFQLSVVAKMFWNEQSSPLCSLGIMNIQRGPVCQRSHWFSPFDGIHRSKHRHETVIHRQKNKKIFITSINNFQMFPNKPHHFWTKHFAELYFLV